MANNTDTTPIQEYLQIIESAVYGEDMRQAIHDAIEQCYKDGDGATIDLTARDGVSLLNSRLDVLIAGLNSKSFTTMDMTYESGITPDTNNKPTAIRIGNIVQLFGRVQLTTSIKLDNFGAYKKLFTIPKGWSPIAGQVYTSQRFTESYGIRLTKDATAGTGIVAVNRYGEDSKDDKKYPITIPNNTVLAVSITYLTDDEVGSTTPSGTSEIEDARIAKDGTVYESLGAAIRSISPGDASDYRALAARVEADEVKITALETDNTSNKSRIAALEAQTADDYTIPTNAEIDAIVT